jgi:methyltransferase-like protein
MNVFNRQELVEAYIDRVLDNMSTKDLIRIVADQLDENLSTYSDEELINEVMEYYPELLGIED